MPNSRGPAREDALPAFSPRAVLGAAVDDPTMLQRLKFHADEQQVSLEHWETGGQQGQQIRGRK